MAGRLGNERITVQNLFVIRIDSDLDLIYVKGAVPGVDDADVMVRDAKKKITSLARAANLKGLYDKVLPKGVVDLPFPAGTAEMAKDLPSVITAVSPRSSPFLPME
jgi:large subunit ribosomal protein L3